MRHSRPLFLYFRLFNTALHKTRIHSISIFHNQSLSNYMTYNLSYGQCSLVWQFCLSLSTKEFHGWCLKWHDQLPLTKLYLLPRVPDWPARFVFLFSVVCQRLRVLLRRLLHPQRRPPPARLLRPAVSPLLPLRLRRDPHPRGNRSGIL